MEGEYVILFFIILIALFVKLFTKAFSFTSLDYNFTNAKKSAIKSLVIIILETLICLLYILLIDNFIAQISGLGILLLQSFIYILLTVIVVFTVLHDKESLQSIGISKLNLQKSCVLGIILGIIVVFVTGKAKKIMTMASFISFIEFMIVGFAEEIIFRGYLQTRLNAWLGKFKGYLIIAIIFSFFHFHNMIILKGIDLETAFINCAKLIPLSLMFGYIMIKTENITSVSILHTFYNWVQRL